MNNLLLNLNKIIINFTILLFVYSNSWAITDLTNNSGCSLDMNYKTHDYDQDKLSLKHIELSTSAIINNEIITAVIANNVTDLYAYNIIVKFNAKRLSFIQGVTENAEENLNNILKQDNIQTLGFITKKDNNKIIITNTMTGTPEHGANGSGILALLKFKVLDEQPDNFLTLYQVNYIDINDNNSQITNLFNSVINPIGDINKDGQLNIKDIIIALQIMVGINRDISTLSISDIDINNDNRMDIKEIIYLFNSISKIQQ